MDVATWHFNNCLPIPVHKQYVNSTRQNGFSNDSACMYHKKMHEAAWGCGGSVWRPELSFWILSISRFWSERQSLSKCHYSKPKGRIFCFHLNWWASSMHKFSHINPTFKNQQLVLNNAFSITNCSLLWNDFEKHKIEGNKQTLKNLNSRTVQKVKALWASKYLSKISVRLWQFNL